MAAPDQLPKITDPLVTREPSIHGPSDNGDGYDAAEFVRDLRRACVTPHVAQKARQSAIDCRTTRHDGYALSLRHRKRIEEAFGWAKTVGGMAQTMYRGLDRVPSRFILTMAANNLARLPRLLAA